MINASREIQLIISERNKSPRKYMKTDFSIVIFNDDCRVILDGHNGYVRA